MSTIFTKIINREIPSEIIYEDDNAIAFLDITPKAPGHSLVVPKKEVANILEADEETIKNLFIAVKKVTAMLKKTLKPDGFNIGLNHNHAGGQTVDHMHVHIIPRFEGDNGGSMHSIVDNEPKEELASIAKMIANKA